MKNFWLYLHFPHLQLDTLFIHNNKLRPQPIAILEGRQNVIVQANKEAREAGIQSGMGLGTAAALAHNLQVIPYQAEVEQTRLQELANHLYQVTSDIILFSPDGLLLRIHHMLHLYGGLMPYWRVIQHQLTPLEVTYHFATGHSGLAARILARQQYNQICADVKKLKTALAQCPISATELDQKIQHKLARVGIHQIGKLLTLPLKDLAKRFDNELVTYLGRLTGKFYHPLTFFTPQCQFERSLELLFDISHSQSLQRPLAILLNAMEYFLKVRDLLTSSITLRLHQRDVEPLSLNIGSAEGEYQANKWLELTDLKLQSVKLQAPVYAIYLRTGETYLRVPSKADLFSGTKGTLTGLQLISLLEAKLGDQAVFKITMKDDYRPEKSSQYCSITQRQESIPGSLLPMRPSFILNVPLPLTDKVRIVEGPERLHTGWWDEQGVVRDYYIARSPQGQWLWIFRTPQNQWFVQGLFS